MSSWRAARCLTALIKQVNTAYPDRPRESDGLIGDQAHAARASSHNPDQYGVVRGWDCTTDHHFTDDLAEQLRLLGKAGDPRVLYVIYQRRIASSRDDWAWRTYTGTDPHTSHIHLSVSDDPAIYDSTRTWPVLDRVRSHTVSKPTPVQGDLDMLIFHSPSHSYARIPGWVKVDPKLLPLYRDKGGVRVVEVTDAQWTAIEKEESK